MRPDLPVRLAEQAERQRGVITRHQALSSGLTAELITSRVKRGRWQRIHAGVYAVFTGPVDREAALWAVVLRAGDGAALSCQTAAELDHLIDKPAPKIHVMIPASRRITPIPGVVVHARLGAEGAAHPARLPPRTRLEETVLDLSDDCADPGDAVGWITTALGRRLTTQELLREAMARRSRLRWRADLTLVLSPDLAGFHSALEYRYFQSVERPHGLPHGRRQAKVTRNGHAQYRDVLYDDYAVAVELDGRVAHPGDTRWLDIQRDNAAAADGVVTLRYGYRQVTRAPCLVAAQLSDVLRLRGWQGRPRPCSPSCPIRPQP
jgi:hypothetical protein